MCTHPSAKLDLEVKVSGKRNNAIMAWHYSLILIHKETFYT